jgi:hypothetical protein
MKQRPAVFGSSRVAQTRRTGQSGRGDLRLTVGFETS